MLTIGAYEAAEPKEGPAVEAFTPRSFAGYQVRPKCNQDVAQWMDWNVEKETQSFYVPNAEHAKIGYRNNSFAQSECAVIASIRDCVRQFSQCAFGKPYKPLTSLLVQIGPYRLMQQLAATMGWMPWVFEIGPGQGYLGALLAKTGYRYASTDCLPALYIWQNWLLELIAGNEFSDFVESKEPKRVTHLPWWRYVESAPHCDVIYSNACLSEMSPEALMHSIQMAQAQLSQSPLGLWCFFTYGAEYGVPAEDANRLIQEAGFHKVEGVPFEAFVVKPENVELVQETFRHGISSYGDLDARTVMALKRDEAPPDVAKAKEISGFEPPWLD